VSEIPELDAAKLRSLGESEYTPGPPTIPATSTCDSCDRKQRDIDELLERMKLRTEAYEKKDMAQVVEINRLRAAVTNLLGVLSIRSGQTAAQLMIESEGRQLRWTEKVIVHAALTAAEG
jgi:hypothetical protein